MVRAMLLLLQCHLLTVISTLGRAFLKVVAFAWLYTNYPNDVFVNSARWVGRGYADGRGWVRVGARGA